MSRSAHGNQSRQRAVDLADAFGRAGKTLVRALDERLGDHGVSTPRSKVLFEVNRCGPVRLTDLARTIGITQGTASTLIDALVREGLIERSPDDSDRRVTLLKTTTAGRAQAEAWATAYTAAAEELFSILSSKEQLVMTDMLHRLADSVTD
ncbi:MarR family transcriptional regulator [Mycolicibacterium sphagni]|uniref:MarR family transcriptional regulator n=1 Tax=Mycolicibacterium sphagni TaxID=1786 RepID=A0A255D9X5_9MYCO|nr:winged helix-turn-helix transcriptional regulator [Mycolicibacterium sphagni]OYN75910.1 MarR family transcriptional regulator [Mycolicibacterium sphagni]